MGSGRQKISLYLCEVQAKVRHWSFLTLAHSGFSRSLVGGGYFLMGHTDSEMSHQPSPSGQAKRQRDEQESDGWCGYSVSGGDTLDHHRNHDHGHVHDPVHAHSHHHANKASIHRVTMLLTTQRSKPLFVSFESLRPGET